MNDDNCKYEADKDKIRSVQDKLFQMIVDLDAKTDGMYSTIEDFNNFLSIQSNKDLFQDTQLEELKQLVNEAIIAANAANEKTSQLSKHLDNGWKEDLVNKVETKIEIMKLSLEKEMSSIEKDLSDKISDKVVLSQQKSIEQLLGVKATKSNNIKEIAKDIINFLTKVFTAGGVLYLIADAILKAVTK